ncbi:hypothetical protein BGW37DRAFT_108332 [Umbelopsis sp. PMI_123]|nr:hypothetical protein BGW37DRAFT_108332 [Umbelopsis sp. PMI_123]
MLVLISFLLYIPTLLSYVACQQTGNSSQTPPAYQVALDTQKPLIARVGQPYSWTFLPTTFSSNSNLTYSISGNANWLSVHDRTLIGTPSGDDIGQSTITITATDSIGLTTNGTMQVIVSSVVAPTIAKPLATQLENAISSINNVAGVGSLRVQASQAFTFTFATDTFYSPGQLYYSANVLGTISLPSWLSFDGNSQTFSGTPPANMTPQTLTIVVDATDIQNYTGVDDYFNISVYQHQLSIVKPIQNYNVTQGNTLSIIIPSNTFAIDGVVVTDVNRTTTVPKLTLSKTIDGMGPLPSWLLFNNATWTLQCSPDAAAGSMMIFFLATDATSDQVTGNFTLTVNGHAPPDQLIIIPDAYIYSETVDMKLPLATTDPGSNSPLHYKAWFIPQNGSASWLTFNEATNTVSGHTESMDTQNITVLITGFNEWNGSASTCYHIFLQPGAASSSGNSATRILSIVLPTVLGTLLLISLLICLCFYLKRKRAERRQRFIGESTIPPMAKPVAYNDPIPAFKEGAGVETGEQAQQEIDMQLSRYAEPQVYASRRLSSSGYPNPNPNRNSVASGTSDVTVLTPGTRPWSQASTLRNSVRHISDGESFNQMFAEEVRRSAAAKEAAWRKSLALDNSEMSTSKPWIKTESGDEPRGQTHGGHTSSERDISDLQIGEPLVAAVKRQPPLIETNASSTSASYITARSSQESLSSASVDLTGIYPTDLGHLESNGPYSATDAEFHSSGDTIPTVGKYYPNGSNLSFISRPSSTASAEQYSTYPTYQEENEPGILKG